MSLQMAAYSLKKYPVELISVSLPKVKNTGMHCIIMQQAENKENKKKIYFLIICK